MSSRETNQYSYLVLYRPPAREMGLDALEDLYRNYEDAKAVTTKFLQKWRPSVLEVKAEAASVEDVKSPIPAESAAVAAA